MKNYRLIQSGTLVECAAAEANVIVYLKPDKDERTELSQLIWEDMHTVDSMLDPEEGARVEMEDEYTVMIWKRPSTVSVDTNIHFGVNSAGIILRDGKIFIISSDEHFPLNTKEFRGVRSPQDMLLRCLLYSVHHFQDHLRAIKMITAELQDKLNKSMENHYFLQMFAISESLIYYMDALESNAALLQKLNRSGRKLQFSEDEVELLEDIVIEQNQCNRQTEVHSHVLAGLMDARGNIINNNMNMLLKNLTLINVVFLPLNLLAGIGGMSEYTALTSFMNPYLAFALFIILMIPLSWVTWILLSRWMEKLVGIEPRRKPRK